MPGYGSTCPSTRRAPTNSPGSSAAPRASAGMFPWVVRLATEYQGLPAGTVVGMSSYLDVSAHDARLEIGATAYRASMWGTAVNPDTKVLLLRYAFEELHVGRVQLKTDVRNARSQTRHRTARRPLRRHVGSLSTSGRRDRS